MEELVNAIADMKEEEAIKLANEMLGSGESPLKIIDLCREAMDLVGKRFENGEYFLPELIMAGEMLTKITDMVKPKLTESVERKRLGKVVIGTVQGDIHDIGKNIVTFMLDVNGFEVHDLGVDTSPQRFIEAIKEVKPEVVGLSGFLTLAYDSMKKTIEEIKNAGLGERVKIMIGGGQIDDRIREYTNADAYGKDAMAAVNLAKEFVGGG